MTSETLEYKNLVPCSCCKLEVAALATSCPRCGQSYPGVDIGSLTICVNCNGQVIKETFCCIHCHKNPNLRNRPVKDYGAPQFRTATVCASAVTALVGILGYILQTWPTLLLVAVSCFFIASMLSFWRGNQVRLVSITLEKDYFDDAGEWAMKLIYIAGGLIGLEMAHQILFKSGWFF